MPSAETPRSIGAVTKLLSDHINRRTMVSVAVGRPESATTGGSSPKINLFLYETHFDGSLQNLSLEEGQPPPLWLSLKYIITAFDESGLSDSGDAHELLGRAAAALQEVSYLPLHSLLPAGVLSALKDNPEPLKITFDEASADLLSKLMQGTDEKYRISIAFQVRPVLIMPSVPPNYGLLVGIDYTQSPPATIGMDGFSLDVIPSLGPSLDAVTPDRIDFGGTFVLTGNDLHLANLDVLLGGVPVPVIAQQPDRLTCRADLSVAPGQTLSAGALTIVTRQNLPSGRTRDSAPVIGRLLPTLSSIAGGPFVADGDGNLSGPISATGELLGTDNDDIVVAFYRDGAVALSIDVVTTNATQTALSLSIAPAKPLPPGEYRVILLVNGQQAKNAPRLTLA
jgi:hypothetical protein